MKKLAVQLGTLILAALLAAPALAAKPGSDTTPPVTTATPPGGTFGSAITVSLTVDEPATIYYTTDGSNPSTQSTVFTDALNIAQTTTLKFFAKDIANNSEAVKTEIYTISTTPPPTGPHADLSFTSLGMCVSCHTQQANDMYQSVHYQWQGDTPQMLNQGGAMQGKISNSVNSYCINILGNWNGCGACHVGTGAQPVATANPSTAQLQSIDCLLCHQKEYKRVRNAATGLFEPDTANMAITMDQAVRTVHRPQRANCLQCHAKAGGGDAVKRGDLAMATAATTDVNYDRHMATTGANLNCQSCHTFTNHRVAGRGSDLRSTDSAAVLECTNCHANKATSTGHVTADVNRHVKRVACQSCHIPYYAKNAADTAATEATETHRTWLGTHSTTPPLHPAGTKANDLIPKYRHWNKYNTNYLLGDVAVLDPATGAYPTSRPAGGINDLASKLYPFKYKTAEQPITLGSRQLIALDTSYFFATADPVESTKRGLANMGMSRETPYEWVLTDTFQMLNHQVPPASAMLQCASCHGSTTQMDLKGELGYALKAPSSVVCSQCHTAKNPTSYTKMHNHTNDRRQIDCSWCHTFSRPELGRLMPN
jgi:nitrate reductase cytochrome c-type subunit